MVKECMAFADKYEGQGSGSDDWQLGKGDNMTCSNRVFINNEIRAIQLIEV